MNNNSTNFKIGPVGEGVLKNIKPYAIPDDAFDSLINAYQWRGRIVRRSGYSKLGRLSRGLPVMGLRTRESFTSPTKTMIAFDTTHAYSFNGANFVDLPSVMPTVWSGQNYQLFYSTNYSAAFWATNGKSGLHGYKINLFAGAAGAGPYTVNVTTTTANNFIVGDQIYFLNVTGASAANNLRSGTVTVAGTTFTISSPTGGTWANGAATSGIALSTTRSVAGQDGIRYYGVLTDGTGWANYNPPIDPNNALAGALLIFAYRGYLVFLNTYEGNDGSVQNFGNRARWTQIGTPYYSLPVPNDPAIQSYQPEAARDDLFGKGGANDAPTNEYIIGAAFIRDILVVYFQQSTWRLRFVNNSQNPFVWERINIEFGSDCTFSIIPFDKGVMAIGDRGIVISDANDTIRFDEKIPEQIFNIRQTANGLQRVAGIRTFRTKLNFWAYPSADNTQTAFNNEVLVYNYEDKTWSIFDDSFTCFGYYNKIGNNITWGDLTDAWSSYTTLTWDGGIAEEGFENIVAGNQQGYVLVLEEGVQNEPSLSISAIAGNVFTSANNNLFDGDWITLSGVTGTTTDDGVSLNGRNFQVNNPSQSADDFTLSEFTAINGGNASGTTYTYTISFQNLFAGSAQINVGSVAFTDPNANGVLVGTGGVGGSGTIDYSTGLLNLTFNSAIGSTSVWIRVVSQDPLQDINSITLTGVYGGSGEISKISNFEISTKYFNFFNDDNKNRLSKIDFYTDSTSTGQFTCNVFADSSNVAINKPLLDNPKSNIVLTTRNPYQVSEGNSTIYRLFCDAVAQTLQLQLTLSKYQMAVNSINRSSVVLQAMMISMRKGGRII